MSELIAISSIASPEEEQDWNRRQLSSEVVEPSMRFWTYQSPGVVLGCSQRGLLSAVGAAQRAGIPLAGRQAGGGAVLTGAWMLSVSIVLPVSHPLALGGTVAGYRRIGEGFASVLRDSGVDAHALTPAEARTAQQDDACPDLQWACYGGLSPWEVVVGKRKIVGLAQVRRRTGVLVAAGLLVGRPDWAMLCDAVGKPGGHAAMLAQRTSSCEEELGWQPPLADLALALRRQLREAIHLPLPADNRIFVSRNDYARDARWAELFASAEACTD
ncbi:lipoate--protein ligase family protein [Noviherbaspirillum denitrificans]|uniref:lipoate--protein ligase family protein n=1 Tax=Noviherbaspirillum denitrificans TaxID=1968433 RepID=UPI001980710F|nr:ligase [Noviherbaspirillum denitrificans]